MSRFRVVASLILFTTILYGQSSAPEWKSINGDFYNIEYPASWGVDTSGNMGASFIIMSPREDNADNFQENVNLLVQDLTGHDMNLIQFVELSENQVRTFITDGEILLTERHAKGETEYQKVIYTGKQGIYNLKFEQFYWVIDDMAYVLTLTCEEDNFDAYQEMGEKILNSFELAFTK